MPPLRRDQRDPRANTQKLIFEHSFVNLTHFSVKDVPFSIKSTKIDKIHKIHTPKFQGRVFSEVAEPPEAGHHQSHSSGGTLKPVKLVHVLVRTNFGDEIDFFSNTHTHIFHVAIRHLHAQAHITSVGSESYIFPKMLTFQNLKTEILKCPWEHFPCVGSGYRAIYGEKSWFWGIWGGWGFCRILFPIYIYTPDQPQSGLYVKGDTGSGTQVYTCL